MAQNRTITVATAAAVVIVIGASSWLLLRDTSVSDALALQAKLTSGSDAQPQLRKEWSASLVRMVDKMDRDELRALGEQVRDRSRAEFEANLAEYLDASESERTAILDEHIAERLQWNTVYEALRTDAFRGRRGPRRNRQPNQAGQPNQDGQNQAARQRPPGNQAARQGPPENRGRPTGGPPQGRRPDGPRMPREADENPEAAEYWVALTERAEARGIELRGFGRRRGPGGRRG